MNSNTKIIRLGWLSDDVYTFEDYIIPKDTPDSAIELAIDLALAIGEDECAEFVNTMNAFGYETKERVEKIEVFNFNGIKNETIQRLHGEYDSINTIIQKVTNSNNEDKYNLIIKQLDEISDELCDDKLTERVLGIAI